MNLTKDDLQALKRLIDDSIDSRIPDILENRIQPMLDKLEDSITRQTAIGFAEVHTKIADLQTTVDRIDQTLQAEIMRNDHQDEAINRMRKALHAA